MVIHMTCQTNVSLVTSFSKSSSVSTSGSLTGSAVYRINIISVNCKYKQLNHGNGKRETFVSYPI